MKCSAKEVVRGNCGYSSWSILSIIEWWKLWNITTSKLKFLTNKMSSREENTDYTGSKCRNSVELGRAMT